jgi:hypothetical protein
MVAPEVAELRERVGLADNPLLCLDFFLGRVNLVPGNLPVLLLVRSAARLEGAVYLFQKTLFGFSTGYLRGFDHLTGESSVIAHEEVRLPLLEFALRQLFLKTNALVAWATVSLGTPKPIESRQQRLPHMRLEVSSMRREHRLKLSDTFAATLSRFGSHTRRNLRYYRRRAEKDIGVSFHRELTVAESSEALTQLSQCSFQPFAVSMAEWRTMNGLLLTQPGCFAVGLRANGEWISYLAGIRRGNFTYALLQINHNGFARHSISTVLRSYFLENEIELGQKEIKFVNGTCAFFQRCCEADTCVTVSARRGFAAFIIFNWIAPWHSAPDHALNIQRWSST